MEPKTFGSERGGVWLKHLYSLLSAELLLPHYGMALKPYGANCAELPGALRPLFFCLCLQLFSFYYLPSGKGSSRCEPTAMGYNVILFYSDSSRRCAPNKLIELWDGKINLAVTSSIN